MTRVTVRVPMPLRSFTGGADDVEVEARTVGEALQAMGQCHAGLLERVLDVDGAVRRFVNIYVGEVDIRDLGGLETMLEGGEVLSIVPAVAGGSGRCLEAGPPERRAYLPGLRRNRRRRR